MNKIYISKEELVKLLLDNYNDTGYIDESLSAVLELIDTIPTITIDE